MSKKNKRKQDPQIIRELSLILVGFTYLWDRIQNTDKEDKSRDVELARALCMKSGFIIRRFTIDSQQKALDLNTQAQHLANQDYNKAMGIEPIDTETKVNVFSLGLALFGQYHEIKNKKIHLGMLNELIDLQDYGEKNIDYDEKARAYKFSDFVLERTMTLPIG